MGRLAVVPVAGLEAGWVLAPERYDPRRRVAHGEEASLGELVAIHVDQEDAADGPVLVLDTSHARDGFVLHHPDPVGPGPFGSAKRSLRPGDVIVSRLRTYLRQVAYVDDALFRLVPGGNAVAASTEFFVLRPRGPFPVAALVPYLLSAPVQAALEAAQEGGHHPRVSKQALAALPVPASVLADAPRLAAELVRLAEATRSTMLARDTLVRSLG